MMTDKKCSSANSINGIGLGVCVSEHMPKQASNVVVDNLAKTFLPALLPLDKMEGVEPDAEFFPFGGGLALCIS
jgi:hypothetical protein